MTTNLKPPRGVVGNANWDNNIKFNRMENNDINKKLKEEYYCYFNMNDLVDKYVFSDKEKFKLSIKLAHILLLHFTEMSGNDKIMAYSLEELEKYNSGKIDIKKLSHVHKFLKERIKYYDDNMMHYYTNATHDFMNHTKHDNILNNFNKHGLLFLTIPQDPLIFAEKYENLRDILCSIEYIYDSILKNDFSYIGNSFFIIGKRMPHNYVDKTIECISLFVR